VSVCRDCKAEIVWVDGKPLSNHFKSVDHLNGTRTKKPKPKPLTVEQKQAVDDIVRLLKWKESEAKELARCHDGSAQEIVQAALVQQAAALERSGKVQ